MIIANLRGGLGNQMFIYAFGKYLAQKHNTELKLDNSYYEDYHRVYELNKLGIKEKFASQSEIEKLKVFKYKDILPIRFIKSKILGKESKKVPASSYILDSDINFRKKYLKLPDNVYLDGLFQSEKFFRGIKDILRQDFQLKNELDQANKSFLEKIKTSNSVSLHIRRGDYITNSWAMKELGVCSIEYYKKSIDYIGSKIESPVFFVFSDDLEWVKNNFDIKQPCVYVDCNDGNTGEKDLELMKNCKHHICANSSFSWWGAWLGEEVNTINIVPEKWFKGEYFNDKYLIPDRWVKL